MVAVIQQKDVSESNPFKELVEFVTLMLVLSEWNAEVERQLYKHCKNKVELKMLKAWLEKFNLNTINAAIIIGI